MEMDAVAFSFPPKRHLLVSIIAELLLLKMKVLSSWRTWTNLAHNSPFLLYFNILGPIWRLILLIQCHTDEFSYVFKVELWAEEFFFFFYNITFFFFNSITKHSPNNVNNTFSVEKQVTIDFIKKLACYLKMYENLWKKYRDFLLIVLSCRRWRNPQAHFQASRQIKPN